MDAKRGYAKGTSASNAFETMEANAIKRVIREQWQQELGDKSSSVELLNDHAAQIFKEFGSLGYETICMQSIATRAKHMSRSDLIAYTKVMEALAFGYKSRFGREFAALMLAGTALVAKNTESIIAQLDYFMSNLSKGAARYESAMASEAKALVELDAELRRRNAGPLRFFRKRELEHISSRIAERRAKMAGLERKRQRYASLEGSVGSMAQRTGKTKPGNQANGGA